MTLVYLLGCLFSALVCALLIVKDIRKGWTSVTRGDVLVYLCLAICSWLSILVLVCVGVQDTKWARKKVFTIKRKSHE